MCLLGKESMLIVFLIATNEIRDISISFLNEHLEETLGPIEIEENRSKCINLTQARVSS